MTTAGKARGGLWVRWRVPLGYPVGLACFWFARPTQRSLAWGAAIAAVGVLLRAAAAGHLRKGESVATSGPYAYTRNPLYFGSAMLAAGFLVASRSWIAAIILSAYFAAFYPVVMRREEQELRERYGQAFEDYVARVPRFWPRLTPAAAGHEGGTRFSWAVYRRNREYEAALGFLAGIVLLGLVRYWRR
jgi:uncharacterized membrane protein